MSEEILKALMQLFAIISKQDIGVSVVERDFVEAFLKQQLSRGTVAEYLALYETMTGYGEVENVDPDEKNKRRTSMKDSVRTLTICEKINKTLTQKQKIVVLVRILELVKCGNNPTRQREELIESVSMVFNISKEELALIHEFVLSDNPYTINSENSIIIDSAKRINEISSVSKVVTYEGIDKPLSIIHVKSVDLYFIKYKGAIEITINGLILNTNNVYLLAPGSAIRLPQGTLYYSDVVSNLAGENEFVKIAFDVSDLEFRFPNGHLALRGINLSEESGRLVALMGGSGSGKTTLLNVLSGLEKPSSGAVTINNINIHKDAQRIEGLIGYVAQDDLLIEELTVFENLYFNAKLCFKDYQEQAIVELVNQVLSALGLFEIKEVKVGSPMNKKISGGQRKRLNIALELIREPSVLFVDEPTSGLSSRDSENIMDLLKELSLKGKLIFVVIHQPSSDIFKMFDKLLLLDIGGLPIYYGNPIDAMIYFKKQTNQINAEVGECHVCANVNPEFLFNLIEARVVDEYGNTTNKRKTSAREWHELFVRNISFKRAAEISGAITQSFKTPGPFNQFKVFIKRDVLSKISNKQYVLINLLEAPFLAFILSFIIRYVSTPKSDEYIFRENDNVAAYIFMCVIISLFIGLSVSAEEIFKDRKILKRESFLNLSRGSYLFSKLAILFSISGIQTLLFVLIGNSVIGIKGLYLDYWFMLFSCSCLANMIGLNISVLFNSAVTIYILIPLIIIPQMLLGGAMFNFDKLNQYLGGGVGKNVPVIADFMASRWAFEGLATQQFKENKFEKLFYPYEKKESVSNFKQAYYVPKLQDKLEKCRRNISNSSVVAKQELENDLNLLKFEFREEIKRAKIITFPDLERLSVKSFNEDVANDAAEFLEFLKSYYADAFNAVNAKKQSLILSYQVKDYEKLYNNYFNDNLKELVCKDLTKIKILEDKNRLVQVLDPVYHVPDNDNSFEFRTHFYAPQKKMAGFFISTYYFNIIVLWLISLVLFLVLYFDIINKLINRIYIYVQQKTRDKML